jgi:cell division FtsZ-interacting protein ZapD
MVQCLEEHLRWILAIWVAYNGRAQIVADLQAAEAQLVKRQESLKKHQASTFRRADKIQGAQGQVEEAQEQVNGLRQQVEESASRLLAELDAYDALKSEDFLRSVRGGYCVLPMLHYHTHLSTSQYPFTEFIHALAETQRKIIAEWRSYFVPEDSAGPGAPLSPDPVLEAM